MSLQRTRLADIVQVASSAASVYSNPAATKTFIRGVVLFNSNTTPETVKLYNVPDASGSAGSATAANQFTEIVLVTKETLIFDFLYPLVLIDEADTLQAETTTASKVTIQILGDVDA